MNLVHLTFELFKINYNIVNLYNNLIETYNKIGLQQQSILFCKYFGVLPLF